METENRTGPRYLASLEVKAEWDEPTGTHIVAEGMTENVGPEGTLVHLPKQLPDVGSRVRLEVLGESGEKLQVIAEVLRIERHPGHPLAALQLLGETDEWKGLIWEPAAPRVTPPPPAEGEGEEEAESDDDGSYDRRRFPRYYVTSRVTLAIEDESLNESLGIGEPQDISLGGLRVTNLPSCPNVKVGDQLGLLLLDGDDALSLTGEVVHHSTPDTFGVEFRGLSTQDQRAVVDLIGRLHARL
jgi:hypothetical protein